MVERHNDYHPMLPSVDLMRLSTPREACLMVTVGVINREMVDRALMNRFDQLPVLDGNGNLCGVVASKHVAELLERDEPLVESDPAIELNEIDPKPGLLTVLQEFSEHRSLVIRDTTRGERWFGLVTLSDLNRHAFRALLYPVLAQLEELMANFIVNNTEDHWDWLKYLSEDAQARLIGRWEIDKRKSVDIDVMAGCTLTEMITIVQKSKVLSSRLGFTTTNRFREQHGAIPEIRNRVMHPVRPLVSSQSEVCKLYERITGVVELSSKLAELTKDRLQSI